MTWATVLGTLYALGSVAQSARETYDALYETRAQERSALEGTTMMCHDHIVDMRCPKCGKVHRVASYFQLDGGPTEPGSLVDLYGDGELPPALANLLDDLVWYPTVEKWTNQKDRRRVFLTPRRAEAG